MSRIMSFRTVRIFAFIPLFIYAERLFAQQFKDNLDDSLVVKLKTITSKSSPNSEFIKYLESNAIKKHELETQKEICRNIIRLVETFDLDGSDIGGIAEVYIAHIYIEQQRYQTALSTLIDLKSKRTTSRNVLTEVDVYMYSELSYTYKKLGNYDRALDCLLEICKNDSLPQNEYTLAKVFTEAAEIYRLLNNRIVAKAYLERALKMQAINNDILLWARAKIGLAYLEIENQNLTAAEKHLNEVKKQTDKLANIQIASELYFVMAILFEKQNKLEGALERLFRAKQLSETTKDKLLTIKISKEIARIYTLQKQYNKAEFYLAQAINLTKQYGITEDLLSIYENMAFVQRQKGNYLAAYDYQKVYSKCSDSINKRDAEDRLLAKQIEFDSKQKDNEIKNLEKTNDANKKAIQAEENLQTVLIILIIAAIIVLLLLIVMISDRVRKNRILKQRNNDFQKKNQELILIKGRLEKSEKRLNEMNQTKDKFFSIIAHDIRSPLNSQKGFADLLSKYAHKLSIEDIKEMAGNQQKTLKGLYELLDNLLTWARAQLGAIEMKPEMLLLEEVFDDIRTLFMEVAQRKKITLNVDTNTKIKVWADNNALNTVLRNMVSNALKFTKEQGNVIIMAKTLNAGRIEILVQDTGVGMSEQAQKQLFRLDTKYSTRGTADETGTGLGLVIVQEFVERMHGTIRVESQENIGSTFSINLPAIPVPTTTI